MHKKELNISEYDTFYAGYLSKLDGQTNLFEAFSSHKQETLHFFENISDEKLLFAYAKDKWTIKEVFQHLIDSERIFMMRCFRIARRDVTPLPGFDQNIYIAPSRANEKSLGHLLEEFKATRQNSIVMLDSFTQEDLNCIGVANNGPLSARAAAFINLGHYLWHQDIINERYL